jgi:hypothetical protein
MSRPRQRLTCVVCTVCQAITTSNWSRVCSKCSLATLADRNTRDPQNVARTSCGQGGDNSVSGRPASSSKHSIPAAASRIMPLTCTFVGSCEFPVNADNGHYVRFAIPASEVLP